LLCDIAVKSVKARRWPDDGKKREEGGKERKKDVHVLLIRRYGHIHTSLFCRRRSKVVLLSLPRSVAPSDIVDVAEGVAATGGRAGYFRRKEKREMEGTNTLMMLVKEGAMRRY
jgi:hypothetical protein